MKQHAFGLTILRSKFTASLMATAAILELSNLIQGMEDWLVLLDGLSCTEDQLNQLDGLGTRLADATTTVRKKSGTYRSPNEDRAWESTKALRSQAKLAITALIEGGKLKSLVLFGKSIVTIFTGPKDEVLDSKYAK